MQWQKRRRNCLEEEELLSFQYQVLSFMVKGGEVGFGKVFLTFLVLSFISSYASSLLLPTFLLQFRESNLGNRNILGVLQKDSRELSPLTCFLTRKLRVASEYSLFIFFSKNIFFEFLIYIHTLWLHFL
jgi:hypothetical protein